MKNGKQKTKLTISGSPRNLLKFSILKKSRKKTVVIDRHVKKPFEKGTGGNYKTSSSNFKKGLFQNLILHQNFHPQL